MPDDIISCPTCGGLCTKDSQTAIQMGMMATPHYRSLLKGEVVAEGWNENYIYDAAGEGKQRYLRVYLESQRVEGFSPVLVIRKEGSSGSV